jgi:glucose/arabinose dehydrogenase
MELRRWTGKRVARAVLVLALSVPAGPTAADDIEARLAEIRLPEGFRIEIFADKVRNARSMTLGEQGTLFVGTRRRREVHAITLDGDARRGYTAREVKTLIDGLDAPNGVAFRDGDLYVAEASRILRFEDVEQRLDDPVYTVITDDYPKARSHSWKYIAFGPDGKLYVPIGAPCNVCEEPGYAVITRINPDGTGREVFAEGVRNTVGFTWHPETGVMWFTDNGRDWMGDDIPPCELNRAPRAGLHFGFPYCHGGDIPDPDFAGDRACDEFTPPARRLGPHVAPLGLKVYTGEMFPPAYRGHLFIAEHGSWNRSVPIGYRISLVRVEDGAAVSYETFAEGWLQGERAWGRPVDVLMLDDGSLLVSDDRAHKIYRITYEGA